ncbi:gliding motility-associated ABC transporter ATP-binding subunit GldA [Fulvivirga lutea]|uniref:Gliding motility-associated ABC transporter ATP-binding subunit GldA n=1 Tax=Fulvivirga lutea TaxID=2810512 RepID=A0A974WET7_9BACT|nr:gliding motility-associated ABC transporter ATP-binding subunit GldA [Fulvivirga lutea]QSE97078.1 gliding motility-associated ABC transporter ATP-binding subunit GldA [Fulvivirga lutea]
MSIRVNQLTKYFGEQKALDQISFSAGKGEIVGFLGPNGAGKSTTMKITTGYLPPDSGTVEVCGIDVEQNPLTVKKKVGYLPEHNPLYLDMYVREYLEFIGKVHKVSGNTLKGRINEVVEMCGLTREQNKLIGALSKGYRQRVGLAQALIHDPEVLVLDEPTTGLDPNQIIEIRNLIKNTSADKTVIFSSHIMQEVQALCDRVVVIDRGRIVADDKIEQLKSEKVEVVSLVLEFSSAPNSDELKAIDGVISIEPISDLKYRIKATTTNDVRPQLFDFASEKGLKLLGLQQEEVTMENVFRELTNTKS